MNNFSGYKLIENFRKEVIGYTKGAKRIYPMEKIQNCCIKETTSKGYFKYNWTVGAQPDQILCNVCESCFGNCYDVKKTVLHVICQSIKLKEVAVERPLNDKSAVNKGYASLIISHAENRGHPLNIDQKAMLLIPNSPKWTSCYAWLKDYFSFVADYMPNTDEEMHLEPCEMSAIYEEYVEFYKDDLNGVIDLKQFYNIWDSLFPHVKIRAFKAVTGILLIYVPALF